MNAPSLVLFIFLAFVVVLAFVRRHRKKRYEQKERELERAETQRMSDCRELVFWFADNLGYVARQLISREELGELVDSGSEPGDIAGEVLKRIENAEGIVLGYQKFADGYEFPVKQLEGLRDRHSYIVGKTGYGKTTLILEMIYQGLERGDGIGVIAPEQEMITEGILPYVPRDRIGEVVYFNPADLDCPICFNPLTLEPEEDIDLKVDENMGIFRRVVGGSAGPRMEEILRQSFYALMERPGFTLLDMERLLSREDPGFRKELLREIKDERTIHFFEDVYPSLPKDAHLPITTRLGRFLRPRFIRNVLCQTERNLNFREAMDEGRILFFNLSDGILGELNAQILGQLVVSKIQLAALSRADVPPQQRPKFYLYIDEFQAFVSTASVSYEKILSRARKYGLVLVLAHQQTNQIPLHLFKEVMGNVSTLVSFMVSADDAARLSKEFIWEQNGEVRRIPPEALLRLKIGECVCKIGRQSFFMNTYPPRTERDYRLAREVIQASSRNYGVPSTLGKGRKRHADKETVLEDLDSLDPDKVF